MVEQWVLDRLAPVPLHVYGCMCDTVRGDDCAILVQSGTVQVRTL